MKKFIDLKWFSLSIILSCLSGLSLPFSTWSYSEIFALITGKSIPNTVRMIIVITVLQILLVIVEYLNNRVINRNVALFNQEVREYLMQTDFVKTGEKEISNRISFINNDLNLIEEKYFRQLFSLVSTVVKIVGIVTVALINSVVLTLVFVAFASLSSLIPSLFSKKTAKQSSNWSKSTGSYVTFMSDLLKNINTVLNYNVLSLFVKKGSKVIKNSVENKRERDDTIAKSDFYVDLLAYSLDFLPIGIGIIMVIQGHIALASFVAVQYSSAWIVNSFFSINSIRNQIAATKPMTAKLLSFKPLTTKQDEAPVKFKQLNMDNVTFGYQADSPVLNNVSLCVNKGDKILLTGKSGEGKSTLLKVLMGKLSPQKGRVLVNDQAVETQIFSEVQQTSQIFNETLRFNLTLGKQFDQKQIMAAVQQAGLTNYVQKHGLDTVIEENGHNLSGGERKRIELARAFLFQREILVVDEGTASLDPQTAEQIHNVFLNSPLTVIEIDHHISSTTMKKFTHHFDLENGKLVNIF